MNFENAQRYAFFCSVCNTKTLWVSIYEGENGELIVIWTCLKCKKEVGYVFPGVKVQKLSDRTKVTEDDKKFLREMNINLQEEPSELEGIEEDPNYKGDNDEQEG